MKFAEAIEFRDKLNSFIWNAGRDYFNMHHRNELYHKNRSPGFRGATVDKYGAHLRWASRDYWGETEKCGTIRVDLDEFFEFCQPLWEIEEFGWNIEEEE